jgi:ribosomal protein S18 acetylase RimI-like enzyme
MVVTAAVETTKEARGGMRPLDPARDLKAVADLIGEAFADQMDERGRAALRELRWMARLSPLVWWWSQADPSFQDAFNGFVWEEPSAKGRGRQVVGNVNLNRAQGSRRRHIICNVVVQGAYRGQGIGRRLTKRAIAEAEALGAQGVVLQAHEDNHPALQLYTDLGFQEATGEIDLRLPAVQSVAILDAPEYRFRSWRPTDGQATYQLAQLATPSVLQWLRPLKADDYRPGWWSRLGHQLVDLIAGRRAYRLNAFRDDRLVATVTVTAAFRQGEHRLNMFVHPDHNGQVEACLVSRALYILASVPSRPVRATVIKEHTATLKVLRDYGFQEQRTLLTLWKDFAQ